MADPEMEMGTEPVAPFRVGAPAALALFAATIAVVAARLGTAVATGRLGEAPLAQGAVIVGAGAGVLVFPTLAGWLAHRAGGGARRASGAVFGLVLAAVVAGQAAAMAMALQNRDGVVAPAPTPAAAVPPAPDGINARLNSDIREAQQKVLDAMMAWARDGGLDFTAVATPDDLARRERLRAAATAAVTDYIAWIEGTEARTRELVLAEGLGESEAERFMRGFEESFGRHKADLLAIRRQDLELLDRVARLHGLLQSEWGAWEINGASGQVEFTNAAAPGSQRGFALLLAEIAEISARQAALQQQQLEAAAAERDQP